MSETAGPQATISRPAGGGRSWRDATTPVSRASRRRLTAVYPLLLAGAAGFGRVQGDLGVDDRTAQGLWVVALLSLFVVFGMLRRGTRRLAAGDHPDLDERDVRARDRAFRLAYPILMVVVAATLIWLFARNQRVDSNSFEGLLIWIALWWAFLPTGVLAWQEPDGLPAEPDTVTALGEPWRDLVLALALVASVALALGLSAGVLAALPLLAVRAVLGHLAWRGSGRPLIEAARIGGLAFGLVLFGVAFTIALVTDGEGSETLGWVLAMGLSATGLALGALAVRRSH